MIGLDHGGSYDLASLVVLGDTGEGEVLALQRSWISVTGLSRIAASVTEIRAMVERGELTVSGGDAVPAEVIVDEVADIARHLGVTELALDPALSQLLAGGFATHGLALVEARQGSVSMSPVMSWLEEALSEGQLDIGNDTLFAWALGNVAHASSTIGRRPVKSGALEISIRGASTAAVEPEGDFADGLSGGPDFWEVTGLSGNGSLNLRAGPSTSDTIVTRLGNGARLQNLGCKEVAGQRWCNVAMATDTAVSGWVTGQYLREAGAAEAGTTDALVPGTNYNATASVKCTLRAFPGTTECPAGVTRGGPSIGTVFITRPDGFERVIKFVDGDVRPMSGVTSFDWSKSGDETTIVVDGEETYVVFDALVFGG